MLLKYHKVQSFFPSLVPTDPISTCFAVFGNPSLLTVQNALNVPFALSNVPLPHALPTLLLRRILCLFLSEASSLSSLSLLSVPDNQNNFFIIIINFATFYFPNMIRYLIKEIAIMRYH